jgi:acyl dehydratase
MPVKTDTIGKKWPAAEYEAGREKIREFANAVGEQSAVHQDPEAAKAAGFRNLVAPPMFCVVYSAPSVGPAFLDPEVGIDWASLLHGSQQFEWGEPVCSGDLISTETTITEIYEKGGMGFYIFESVSSNQNGDETVKGTWTQIVRGV